MNSKQLDECYKNYVSVIEEEGYTTLPSYLEDCEYEQSMDPGTDLYWFFPIPYNKEEFVEKLRSDTEFAQKWANNFL